MKINGMRLFVILIAGGAAVGCVEPGVDAEDLADDLAEVEQAATVRCGFPDRRSPYSSFDEHWHDPANPAAEHVVIYAYVPKTVAKECLVAYADNVRATWLGRPWMVWLAPGTSTLNRAQIFVDGHWWWPRRWSGASAASLAARVTLGWPGS